MTAFSNTGRQQLVVEHADLPVERLKDLRVHRLFEAQVERRPETVAVVFEGQKLTYQELNRRANQLAHYLQSLGVGPEVLCGIYVERSLEMLIGILGILKAGGAYVPIDPTYPAERVAFMLEDAQVPVLLTHQRLLEGLPEHRSRIVCLDTVWEEIACESEANPLSEATGANLAYVIYTSGSTGKPKGVQINHRSVLSLFEATRSLLDFDERDVWTLFHSYAFDFSVWEMWGCLLHGGRLVIVPRRVAQSPAAFYDLLCAERVTVLNQTPSAIRQLVRMRDQAGQVINIIKNTSLRLIICGGEAFPRDVAALLLEWGVSAWNFYGPTEVTVWATAHKVEASDLRVGNIPIGRPLANAQIHLLDSHLQPVPVGVPGELYIGGARLARGYLNRPDLTAERFIPDPFSSQAGARLYKTGDMARYLPTGDIEYLGRIDHQVKVRGFRIELGEIETVLAMHPAVREAVVTAQDESNDEKRLIAYLVASGQSAPSTNELTSYLKGKLPDYMVPSAFVQLDALPLTPHGKVDRRALPAPGRERPDMNQSFVAPTSKPEAQLKQIWEDLLGIEPIGIKDDFFELGGDSLLAVNMLIKVQEVFGKNIPPATLIHEATIEHLASVISSHTDEEAWPTLVEIQPHGSQRPIFFIHPLGGEVLGYSALAQYLGPDQPFYGLRARGMDGIQEPDNRVEDMAAHYIEEMFKIQSEGPFLLGGYSFGGIVAFEMAQQLHAQGHRTALLAILDEEAPNLDNNNEWGPRALINFTRNVPYWLADFVWQRPVSEVGSDIQRHLRRVAKKSIGAMLSPFGIKPFKTTATDIIKLSHLPENHRRVNEAHYQALINYKPRIYPGRITLFRTRAQPLFRSQYYDKGWGKLAAQGVEVKIVPGTHLNMYYEEHAQDLAAEIQASLSSIQNSF